MIVQKTQIADEQPAPAGDINNRRIYMDHNGSTPTLKEVADAMLPFLGAAYGNPSSGHWASEPAIEAIASARVQVANLIGAKPKEIIFTSGATEANNLAIKGSLQGSQAAHIITSTIEHDAVLKTIRSQRANGVKITYLPVDSSGIVKIDTLGAAITENTRLVSVMAANNETGCIQPVSEISKIAKDLGVAVHCDAAQAIGKIPVNVDDLGIDFLSMAGHKFGGPNGVGALYVRSGARLTPQMHGGGHELGRRAGTESALLCVGIGAAAEIAMTKNNSDLRELRDYFWRSLTQVFGRRVVLNGHPDKRVPNTLNVSFPGKIGADILATMPNIAATTGSACHAGCIDMSHVLLAMGKSTEIGLGSLRFSLGNGNTKQEVDHVVQRLVQAIA